MDSTALDRVSRDLTAWMTKMPLEIVCLQGRNPKAQGEATSPISTLPTLCLLYQIACNHLSGLRWLHVAPPSGKAPEYALKNLWIETRAIVNLSKHLKQYDLLGRFLLIGSSVIRPLLLCQVLNRSTPHWMNPFFEMKNIPSLLTKAGNSDSFLARGISYTQLGAEDPPDPSEPETPE